MAPPLAGNKVKASYWMEPEMSYEDTQQAAGAAGSYFSGSPGVAVTFTCPETGIVKVGVSCFALPGAITSACVLVATYRMHEGTDSSGDQVQAETLFANSARLQVFTTSLSKGGKMAWDIKAGLTPGQQYWAELRMQQLTASGGLLQVRGRKIIVMGAI